MTIGFAFCGSFCTYDQVFPVLKELTQKYQVFPIFSDNSADTDTRFGLAEEFRKTASEYCGQDVICSISEAEPIGPKKLLDALIIAPCTGNTLAKIACGIADTPVTMAVKSHLRNNRPVIIAVSTNDGLAGAAANIGKLLARKYFYFVPFGQDDPLRKPNSLVAHFQMIPNTLELALSGNQIQPILQ